MSQPGSAILVNRLRESSGCLLQNCSNHQTTQEAFCQPVDFTACKSAWCGRAVATSFLKLINLETCQLHSGTGDQFAESVINIPAAAQSAVW